LARLWIPAFGGMTEGVPTWQTGGTPENLLLHLCKVSIVQTVEGAGIAIAAADHPLFLFANRMAVTFTEISTVTPSSSCR
jgi:hypothetical protein